MASGSFAFKPLSGGFWRKSVLAGTATTVAFLGFWAVAGPATSAPALKQAATVKPAATVNAAASSSCPWVGSTAPVAQRVEQVMAQLSLGDEIALVNGSGSTATGNGVGNVPAIPSLCVPDLQFMDGPAGVGDGSTGVTEMPAPVAAAASFDTSLEQQYGQVLGSEQASQGHTVELGPTINIVRDPRTGRAAEYFSEDPYVTGQMVAAFVTGLQSTGVIAEVKHFAVYNQEASRNNATDSNIVTQRAENEIYLPAWQSAVQAGAGAIMCAYSFPDGVPACQNSYLLNDLKNTMGFQGFVTSDWQATHSTVQALEAGQDVDMPGEPNYSSELYQDLADGQLPRAYLDDAVERVLTSMFNAGLFNSYPNPYPTGTGSNAAHVATSTQVAEEGTVLLKNSGHLLPLNPSTVGSVAVIGADGNALAANAGGPNPGPYGEGGSTGVNPSSATATITGLAGIQAAVGSGVSVTYNDGTNQSSAVSAAQAANVAIIFVGYYEAEQWSLTSIDLGTADDNLITAVAAANPRTIVVLNTGSAVTMPWLSSVPSVLEQWYPGQTLGTAAAAVILGSFDPSGHLPVTFPVGLGQGQIPDPTIAEYPGQNGQVDYNEGIDVGYRWYQGNSVTPLFPFGFGLSYTTFQYSGLAITGFNSSGVATVSATVKNTGSVAGADVAQLYIGDPPSTGEPPWQLKGYSRVSLAAGASTVVNFSVPVHDLTYWAGPGANTTNPVWQGNDQGGWEAPAGNYNIGVGDSSATMPLTGTLNLGAAIGPDTVSVTNPGNQSTAAGSTVNLGISASDSAGGQALSYTAIGLPGGLSINSSTGAVTGTALHTGTDTVDVVATDREGWEGNASFTWSVTGTSQGPSALPGSVTGPGNLCLADDSSATASPVTLATCDGNGDQVVTFGTDGTLQILAQCMEPANGATASGTNVQLYPCNGSSAQVWTHPGNGELVHSASGLCLDDPGDSLTSGTYMQIQPCSGATEQVWDVAVGSPAGSEMLGPIIGEGELCLDNENGVTAAGNPFLAYTCGGQNSQQMLSNGTGTLMVEGGCIDEAGTTVGSEIVWEPCSGATSQKWTYNSGNEWVNQASGLCMEIPGGNQVSGAVNIDLQTCYGWPQEQWTSISGVPTGPESSTTTPADSTTLPTGTTPVSGANCSGTTTGATQLNETGFNATTNAISSTSDQPQNAITNAINGTTATRFSTDQLQQPGLAYEVNMLSSHSFNEIDMASPNSNGDYALGYNVFVSNNGNSWTEVASCTGTGTPEIVSFPAQNAQYIEVSLTASSTTAWWSINQFLIYNNATNNTTTSSSTTTTVASGTTTTVASGANCSASASGESQLNESAFVGSSSVSTASGVQVPITNAVNGNNNAGRFTTGAAQAPGMNYEVNMGSAHSFNEVDMEVPDSAGDYPRGFNVQVSSNGTSWTTVASCTGTSASEIVSFPAQSAQYVQVVLTASIAPNWWSIEQFIVRSASSGGTTTTTAATTTTKATTTTTAATTTTTVASGANCSAAISGTQLKESAFVASTNAPSSSTDAPQNAITNATDNGLTSRFSTDEVQAPGLYFRVNMGSAQSFNEIDMDSTNWPGDYAVGYSVQVSPNASTWSTVATCTGTGNPEVVSFPAQTDQYVQVVLNAASTGSWWSIGQFKMY